MRWGWWRCRLAIAVVVTGLGLAAAIGSWRLRVNLAEAKRAVALRRHEEARRHLAWIAGVWPGWDEVEYQLGLCERALGHRDAALAAWARVPPGSRYAARAA